MCVVRCAACVLQMLATLAADPIAGLVDTAYMGRLGGSMKLLQGWGRLVGTWVYLLPHAQ
jgi:hypothetical protein